MTLGDIARILVSKGDVDEALKLQQERLEVNTSLGDLDGIGAASADIGIIHFQQESHEDAFKYLHTAYEIFSKIGRLDFSCSVGFYLGLILCQAGQTEQGIEILTRSRDGFIRLGQPQMAEQVEQMIEAFQ